MRHNITPAIVLAVFLLTGTSHAGVSATKSFKLKIFIPEMVGFNQPALFEEAADELQQQAKQKYEIQMEEVTRNNQTLILRSIVIK